MKTLYPHQSKALSQLKNGNILVGGTGSGKTLVALSYYYTKIIGGSFDPPIAPTGVCDLYVITTARKRDDLDWVGEAAQMGLSTEEGVGLPVGKFVVDSWNNIKKYTNISNAFFIFDEQRSTGRGVWAKSLVKIAKKNKWIMLSATPADRWVDLVPVFVANGFFKNRTQFDREHVVYAPYVKYPKIQRYWNEEHLSSLRDKIYVVMPFKRKTKPHVLDIPVTHDQELVDRVVKTEWNIFKDKPIKNLAEHNFVVRRIVNQDTSRVEKLKDIFEVGKRVIVFYNFNFELEMIKEAFDPKLVFEYNGDVHDPLPKTREWLYLVQYLSGSEAWECFTTNHMVFYSLNYSYRITKQAMGRINRMTTPYVDLYYYRFISKSSVDRAIIQAFNNKKRFNDRGLRFT
jgi:hypothetical protein